MSLLPINRKKIVFSTFEGDGGFCCNPRYIAEELHRKRPDIKIVWLTRKSADYFPDYVKVKKYSDWNLAYHLSTAVAWVDNYRKPFGTLKRKGQFYLQTWHGIIGFKPVGLYRGDKFPPIARIVSQWDSDMIDVVISNSHELEKMYPKKLLYRGKCICLGFPRMDPLINDKDRYHQLIREQYNFGTNVKLALFAPTFRGGNQSEKKNVEAEMPTIDFDKLIEALNMKTGHQWNVLLRLHPQLAAKLDEMPIKMKDDRLKDVSKHSDISELLAGSDLVITDYSSCAFDAAFAHIPVLLYADDVEEYRNNRGEFMWKKDELPFDIAETNEKLIDNITAFEYDVYCEKVDFFMKLIQVNEDGQASRRIVNYLSKNILHG